MKELSLVREILFSFVSCRHNIVALEDLSVSLTNEHLIGSLRPRTFQLKIERLLILSIVKRHPNDK
jgi:hypothetical protein